MRVISTYNALHLGDNLIHLNYLYRLSLAYPGYFFKHYVDKKYLDDLNPLLEGIKNIQLINIEKTPVEAVNSWIGHDDYFYKSPLASNWVDFHLNYFQYLSNILELNNPILQRDDLLFCFPALQNPSPINRGYDFLIINSTPLSGQIHSFDPDYLNWLTKQLVFKGFSVMTTHPNGIVESTLEKGLNLLQIAQISNQCPVILGVPNGPMWLTFNKFNNDNLKARIVWVSMQILELGKNCVTCTQSDRISDIFLANKII